MILGFDRIIFRVPEGYLRTRRKILTIPRLSKNTSPASLEKNRSTLYSFFTISNEDQDYEGFETQFYLELKVEVERRF